MAPREDVTDMSTMQALFPRAAMPVHPQQPSKRRALPLRHTGVYGWYQQGLPGMQAGCPRGLCGNTVLDPFCMPRPAPKHLPYILDSFREIKEHLNPTFQNSKFPHFFLGKRKDFLRQKNSSPCLTLHLAPSPGASEQSGVLL